MRLVIELYAMKLLFSKSSVSNVGRTLIFNLLYLLSMVATVIGALCLIVGINDMRALVYMFYPLVGFGQLFFLCATLSVSTVWNSMAKKASLILVSVSNSSLPPASLIRTNADTTAKSKKLGFCCLVKMPKPSVGVDAPITTSLIALTVTMMISYFSPLYISSAMSVCCLVIAISFAAAGGRMARLLTLSTEPLANKKRQGWKLSCCIRSNNGNGNDGGSSHSCSEDSSDAVGIRSSSSIKDNFQNEIEDLRRPNNSQLLDPSSNESSAVKEASSSFAPLRVPSSPVPTQPLSQVTPPHPETYASPPSSPDAASSQSLPQASVGVLQVAAQIRGTANVSFWCIRDHLQGLCGIGDLGILVWIEPSVAITYIQGSERLASCLVRAVTFCVYLYDP